MLLHAFSTETQWLYAYVPVQECIIIIIIILFI